MYFTDILMFVLIAGFAIESTGREVITLSPAFLTKVDPVIKRCEAETNPPADVFRDMLKGIVENEAGFNFVYCYLTGTKLVDNNGRFNVTYMLSVVMDDEAKGPYKKALEDCNEVNGKDSRETVRHVARCYRDNSTIHFTF